MCLSKQNVPHAGSTTKAGKRHAEQNTFVLLRPFSKDKTADILHLSIGHPLLKTRQNTLRFCFAINLIFCTKLSPSFLDTFLKLYVPFDHSPTLTKSALSHPSPSTITFNIPSLNPRPETITFQALVPDPLKDAHTFTAQSLCQS